jgi:hypothetical protein
MNAIGEDSKNDLLKFVKGLNKDQADNIMYCLPQLTALLEEPMLPYLQEPFLRTG